SRRHSRQPGPRPRGAGMSAAIIDLAAERRARGLAPVPEPYADPAEGDVVLIRDSGYLGEVKSVHGQRVVVRLLDKPMLSTFAPLRELQLVHRGLVPLHPGPGAA